MRPLSNITVLVAEDERPVLMLLRVVLESAGARVLTAEDGERALRLLALHPEVDVLCTDLNMPRMDGQQLIHAALRSAPSMPVVVCTASEIGGSAPGLLGIVHGVVRKPFVPMDLVQAIRSAADSGGTRTELCRTA